MTDVRNEVAPAAADERGPNPHGSFIWYELMTTDPEGAGTFYSAVVPGWKFGGLVPTDVDYRMIERSASARQGERR